MRCPVCNIELRIAERQGIEIDYCPQCRGVWLDRGELDKIIERSIGITAEAEADIPHKPKRGYFNDDYSERYNLRRKEYNPHEKRRTSKKKKARDFFEDIFDFFD
ncbi:MAG: hypothetical protein CUN56_05430 [Phototrophicales bacterium]|nr:MAG: hypothetical protein CUN56_05430 [Phototrophicales bacterium]RMG73718.1 MAG: hypothetical protein D6711_10335 [Chloroflexota bacterium]